MVICAFYCTMHISFLMLEYALALKNGHDSRIMKIPIALFAGLLLICFTAAVTVCVLNGAQISSFHSWSVFYTAHLTTLDLGIQLTLYIACGFVMGIKIKQYFMVKKTFWQRKMATVGLGVTFVSFCLNLAHIICLLFYPSQEAVETTQVAYLMMAVLVQLPIIHYMIIRQPNKGTYRPLNFSGNMQSKANNLH